jgi:small-conductance mechanosensitive channel
VGLALQDTLGHIFGGVSLILDNTYNEGDVVELENGNIGTIYSIGYRSSKILTPSNEIIIVPNGQLAKMMVKNLSRPSRLYRLNLVINVAYGSDPAHVKKVILNTAKDTEGVLDDPEALVFFEKMDSYSLNFRLIVSIQTPLERLVVTDKILTRLTDMFKKEKIQVPFPTTTVHIEK